MSAAESIPFELRALNAEEVGVLLGCEARTVLERHACKPEFPKRIAIRPALWIASEVLAYRDTLKGGRRGRRR